MMYIFPFKETLTLYTFLDSVLHSLALRILPKPLILPQHLSPRCFCTVLHGFPIQIL